VGKHPGSTVVARRACLNSQRPSSAPAWRPVLLIGYSPYWSFPGKAPHAGILRDRRRSSACRFYIALRGGLRSLNSSLLGRVNSRTARRTLARSSTI